jgi:hypothetical protein
LHQKSKFAVSFHELENLESNIQDEDAVAEQKVRVDEIDLICSFWKHVVSVDDSHESVNWET